MTTTYTPCFDRASLRRARDELVGGTGWRAAGERVEVLGGAPVPVVRARVALAASVEVVWRDLIVDVITSMAEWNEAYRGGAVLGDDGAGVRRLITRAALPRPFADREDDFEQHAFIDDDGVGWELSRTSPQPARPAPGHAPGQILLAAKRVAPAGDGCVLEVLWQYRLGGVLEFLPRRVRERALAQNLAHECDCFIDRFGRGAT